jgi:hypothetical protein
MKRTLNCLFVVVCSVLFLSSCVSLAGSSRVELVIINTAVVDQRLMVLVDDQLIYRGWVSRQPGEPNIAAIVNLRMAVGPHSVRVERSEAASPASVKFIAHRQATIEVVVQPSATTVTVKQGARIYM